MATQSGVSGHGDQPPVAAEARAGLDALIRAYVDARIVREAASAREKELRAIEDRAEADLFDAMERVNLRSATHDELGMFILSDLAWAKVTDEAKAREWAEHEAPELLLLNRQRLAVVVREALKGERDMPPGVDWTTSRGVNWRRPKGDE